MFDHNRQHVIQTDSTKDDGLGKVFAFILILVMSLAFVQMAFEWALVWYRDTMVWLNEAASYLAGFWPF